MIIRREAVAPWLAASLLVMAAYTAGVVVGGSSSLSQAVLTVALCSVVTATGLVLYRSRRLEEEIRRDERTRPATDELPSAGTPAHPSDHPLPPYAAGMLGYSAAVVELLEHAVGVALEREMDASELASGRDDAAALQDLLSAMATEPVQLRKAAKVHTICSLWEASQERLERAAADLDPAFHRRWRARHLAAIRLRHGEAPSRVQTTLPYREAISTE
jgi:hypothetical protein